MILEKIIPSSSFEIHSLHHNTVFVCSHDSCQLLKGHTYLEVIIEALDTGRINIEHLVGLLHVRGPGLITSKDLGKSLLVSKEGKGKYSAHVQVLLYSLL